MKTGYSIVRGFATVGLVFLPFTTLRFGPVGIGEISLLLALIALFHINSSRFDPLAEIKPVLAFWAFYPLWLVVGFCYNAVFLNYSSGFFESALFDWSAYISVLALILIIGDRNFYQGISGDAFFERIFLYWAIIFSILYVVSLATPAIFGQPLRYHAFFSPLVENVHQAAMITCAMPFVMVFMAFKSRNMLWKVIYLAFAALFVEMAIESGTTKASLAIVVGLAVGLVTFAAHRAQGKGRILLYFMVFTALLIFISLNWSAVDSLAVNFFHDEDGSSARESLYSYGFAHAMDSIIVGYGPGSHIGYEGDFSDAHNTVLTILLQGGIVAVAFFVVTFTRIVAKASVSPALIGVIAAIGIYAAGGDILRRLPIWVLIMGVLIIGSRQIVTRARGRGRVARRPVPARLHPAGANDHRPGANYQGPGATHQRPFRH